MTLSYPPPWMDISTLCAHICVSAPTVDAWVRQGLLPPPRLVGGKRMWKWKDVDRCLEGEPDSVAASPGSDIERVRNATRQAAGAKNQTRIVR